MVSNQQTPPEKMVKKLNKFMPPVLQAEPEDEYIYLWPIVSRQSLEMRCVEIFFQLIIDNQNHQKHSFPGFALKRDDVDICTHILALPVESRSWICLTILSLNLVEYVFNYN